MIKALSFVVAIGVFISNSIINGESDSLLQKSKEPIELGDVFSDEEKAAEEARYKKFKEETKDLPQYNVETVLPTPFPGMIVTYGTDGHIHHILNPDGTDAGLSHFSDHGEGTLTDTVYDPIPTKMEPNTMIIYNKDLTYQIEKIEGRFIEIK
ncbi:hypothetical protein [Chengkuizengella axinellae]|uniref:Uncharacterized protein n=1 Tax=Chengkuizengella axinellae TaxID=3064388 RepID=A0ABT9J4S0_9BACL|nr:hypothetical protein [Chengkuizengella sp. 2205SS18-9]MDP5276619.1 hypothetical protein [Chengkuizengella sp. 2205SS18-9]